MLISLKYLNFVILMWQNGSAMYVEFYATASMFY